MGPAREAPSSASAGSRISASRGSDGYFRLGQDSCGRWTLIDPAGDPFFCKAVHGVLGAGIPGDSGLPPDSAARLRAWGFNASGVGGDGAGRDDGLPFLAAVEFCRVGSVIVAPGVRLPDVFAADWPARAAERAQAVCIPLANTAELLGWVSDDALGWGQPAAGGWPTLLQVCLSLEPAFAAYHAAWEFVLALHGGNLAALARAWGMGLPNKEIVRECTRAEQGIATRGYWRDDARWTREFARRYFTTTSAAIRAADPNHLLLGCRFGGAIDPPGFPHIGANVLAECVYPAVDVAMPDWRELPPVGAAPSHPVLAADVCWVDESFQRPASGSRPRRLTTIERMLRRGRTALDRLARHPAVVGYTWPQWQDEPGEQPPFARGLIHVNGSEAREHTEVLAQFNARAELLRARGPGGAA